MIHRKAVHRLVVLLVFLVSASVAMAEDFSWEKIKRGLKVDLQQYQIIEPSLNKYYNEQQTELENYARKCNQLQLMLYSNKSDYIFYLTATIKQVDKLNKILEQKSKPSSSIIETSQMEQERLQRLRISLLRQAEDERIQELSDTMLSMMDDSLLHAVALEEQHPESVADRDSCIMMVEQLINSYTLQHERAMGLCAQYAELQREFTPTYEYMLQRQHDIRQQVFRRRGLTYNVIMRHLPVFVRGARQDSREGEGDWRQIVTSGEFGIIFGEMISLLLLAILTSVLIYYVHIRFRWSSSFQANPRIFTNLHWVLLCMVCFFVDIRLLHLPALSEAATTFLVYMSFVAIVQISLLIREKGDTVSAAMHLYAPALFFGFCTIFIRLFMLPDSVLTLIVFPLSLCTLIWHFQAFKRYWGPSPRFDSALSGVTLAVLFAMTILSAAGYAFLAMVIFLWWQAQEAALLIALAAYDRLEVYYNTRMKKRIAQYHEKAHSKEIIRQQKGLIQLTWFLDMVKMVGVPFFIIASVPYCMYIALDYFNAGDSYSMYFYQVFYSIVTSTDTEPLFQLSCYNFCRLFILFFIFRYISYFCTSSFEQLLLQFELKRSGRDHIAINQVNLTMGVNIIKILVWASYLTTCCIIFAIPTSALTFIFAGLATGIGFAMRDIINNVFYGLQLMAGRLNVGDYIICGPYRGSVTEISYQTTQMKTEENALVYFPNADLFTKNFMNLTRENPYEVNRVYCNVAYGTDLVLAEQLIREAIEPFNEEDKYGRTRLSAKEGIRVEVTELEDRGIQMAVRFGVIAEQRTWFLPVLRKAIYEKLRAGGIQIPFPQVDLHVNPINNH